MKPLAARTLVRCWQASLAALLLGPWLGSAAWAHRPSEAFVQITPVPAMPTDAQVLEREAPPALLVRVDVALRDLDRAWHLDADDDGVLRWGEVRLRWPELAQAVRQAVMPGRTQPGQPTQPCEPAGEGAPQLQERGGESYAVFEQPWRCAAGPAAAGAGLALQYRLFETHDAGHRGLVLLHGDGAPAQPLVLAAAPQWQPLALAGTHGAEQVAPEGKPAAGFWAFMGQGMAHIAAGLDHILFLFTLLLGAVLRQSSVSPAGPRVQPAQHLDWRAIVREAVLLVSAFTLSHSVTLGLAAAGLAAPEPRWVESVIALSVLLAAIDVLWPLWKGPRWSMAFVFGFFHGFGFAGPLQELGLRGAALVTPLLGFNLGVELGQLAVVAVALPLLLALRSSWAPPRLSRQALPLMRGLGTGIAVLATVWLVERALDVQLLG